MRSSTSSKIRVDYVGGLIIRSRDPASLKTYYENFGLSFFEHEGSYYSGIETESGTTHFGILALEDTQPGAVGFNLRVNDFDAYIEELRAAHIEPTELPDGGEEGRFAEFVDPEGNGFSVWGD